MTHQARVTLYDEFQEYVIDNVRNRDNPNVCLKAYDMVKQNTDTHLEVVLENVDSATKQFWDNVERFKDGTKMKTREQNMDGGSMYCVYIPLKNKKKPGSYFSLSGSSNSSSDKRKSGRKPSQNMLMLYIIGLCGLIIFAVTKTSATEWRQLGFPI